MICGGNSGTLWLDGLSLIQGTDSWLSGVGEHNSLNDLIIQMSGAPIFLGLLFSPQSKSWVYPCGCAFHPYSGLRIGGHSYPFVCFLQSECCNKSEWGHMHARSLSHVNSLQTHRSCPPGSSALGILHELPFPSLRIFLTQGSCPRFLIWLAGGSPYYWSTRKPHLKCVPYRKSGTGLVTVETEKEIGVGDSKAEDPFHAECIIS